MTRPSASGFCLPQGSLECSPNSSLHWSHSLLRFFEQMAVASEKVLWRVPSTILYICLAVSCGFLGKWLLLQKRFCGGFRQLFFTFVCQMAVELLHKSSLEDSANCALHLSPCLLMRIVDMSHPYKSSPQKTTRHVVAVGVFFGLIFLLI